MVDSGLGWAVKEEKKQNVWIRRISAIIMQVWAFLMESNGNGSHKGNNQVMIENQIKINLSLRKYQLLVKG